MIIKHYIATHDLKIDFLDEILIIDEAGDVKEALVKEDTVVDQGKFSSICYLIYLLNVELIILMELLSTANSAVDPPATQDSDQSSF